MTKNEFVDQVASNSGLGKGEASKAVDAVLDTIQETLARRYGVEYESYRRAVPGWWPRWTPWRGRG